MIGITDRVEALAFDLALAERGRCESSAVLREQIDQMTDESGFGTFFAAVTHYLSEQS